MWSHQEDSEFQNVRKKHARDDMMLLQIGVIINTGLVKTTDSKSRVPPIEKNEKENFEAR